ncbi:MAG TPA: hypothetical protein VII73_05100 [Caulobacteraceae bacterium]
MKTQVLFVGVAVALMAAGGASARTRMGGGSYAAPSQPIPYSQLGDYMKASPRQRTAMMASMGATASTGTAANTAALMPNGDTQAAGAPAGPTSSNTTGAMSNDTNANPSTPDTSAGAAGTNPPQ